MFFIINIANIGKQYQPYRPKSTISAPILTDIIALILYCVPQNPIRIPDIYRNQSIFKTMIGTFNVLHFFTVKTQKGIAYICLCNLEQMDLRLPQKR